MRALVEADMATAGPLHADDFQLIAPNGTAFSKDQYLGGVASGAINYLALDLDSEIEVRLHGDVAFLRYRSQIEIELQGRRVPRGRFWHTDIYEQRAGDWQVVWSHATAIPASPPPD